MTHVNLDTQPEPIRQFLLALTASKEGTVLESAGRPVACVVPAPSSASQANGADTDWSEAKNQRRGALLDRKYDQGLTPTEEAELALLQDAMYRYVDRVAPLPLDAARKLHQELLDKASRSPDAGPT
jgi:hypothetical protein